MSRPRRACRRPCAGLARADSVHQPRDPAGPDARARPEPGSPEYPAWAREHTEKNPRPLPVKTVPPHHAPVRLASGGDIAEIFGDPDEKGNFVIGYTREQGHPVCINLDRFVQRSAGVFGATGTGKSFLTRIVLAGLMHYNRASVLVFDMHNEYGYDDTASDTGMRVTGLKTKFASRVRVVGLGAGTTSAAPHRISTCRSACLT